MRPPAAPPGSTKRDPSSRTAEIALVFAGGTLGTLARYGLSLLIPSWGAVPAGTFVVNVTGAFLLGWLIAAIARYSDTARGRALRHFAGTGILGGFTTYSALAVDTGGMLVAGAVGPGLLYAVATVLVGAAASFAGIVVGTAAGRRRAA
jgi:CrcB protein